MGNNIIKQRKSNKGITLIALIITIVVMLILAGVTINLTLGENGIFTTAQKASKNYTDAQNKEMDDLGNFTNLINDTINGLGQGESLEESDKTEQKVTSITLNKTNTTILLNGTETITATITPETAVNKNITWTSSDETVATVENGTVTVLKLGNATITATAQDGSGVSASCEVEVVKQGNLSSIITGEDYGKNIDYSVTVEGATLNNWRVFYNDTSAKKVYIILDGYLPNALIPEEIGMTTEGAYRAWWSIDNFSTNTDVVATLTNTDIWNPLAEGLESAVATGAPTSEMFVNSWNANPEVNSKILAVGTTETSLSDSSKLYIPDAEPLDDCYGYWLASPFTDDEYRIYGMWRVGYDGKFDNHHFVQFTSGIRPLVCLPSGTAGTVGSSVNINN